MVGDCELQVWTYAPIFAADTKIQDKNTVAPLSLTSVSRRAPMAGSSSLDKLRGSPLVKGLDGFCRHFDSYADPFMPSGGSAVTDPHPIAALSSKRQLRTKRFSQGHLASIRHRRKCRMSSHMS